MARRRLSTLHTVIQGPSHSTGYSHHLPLPTQKAAQITAWTPRMRKASGRDDGLVAACRSGARFFQPEMPIASRVSLRRREAPRNRVTGVQAGVGFVGPELIPVMGHMGPAIQIERREGRVGEKPAAHYVVEGAAGKEQAVGGLVAQDIEQGEAPADQEEGQRVGPPPVDGSGRRHHAERLDPGTNHGERIATPPDTP